MLRAPLGDVSNFHGSQPGKLAEKRRSQNPDRRQGKAPVVKPRSSNGKDRRQKEARFQDRRNEMDSMMLPTYDSFTYDQMPQGDQYYMQQDGYYMQPNFEPCYEPCFDDGMMGMQQMQQMQQMQPAMVQPMLQMQSPMNMPQPSQRVWPSERDRDRPKERVDRKKEAEDSFVYPGHPQYAPIDVTVKNTFINLPAPRTPSPSGRYDPKTPPVASTCPPKCLMGEQLRLEREEARAEAAEAMQLFAGKEKEDMKAVESEASVGSLLHRAGLCKPCAWVHHAKGCQRGATCEFCHTCPPGEIKKRKKEKTVQIRKRRSANPQPPLTAEYRPAGPRYEYPRQACW